MSYNRVTLVGNLGKDAEMRYTPQGTAVCTFSLATSERWTGKDGQKQERTEWHRVVLWAKQAEAVHDFLVKGKQILVEGKLQTREWEDKGGNKRYTTEVRCDRLVLLGSKIDVGGRKPTREPGEEKEAVAAEPEPAPLSEDDIPFAWLLPFMVPITAAAVVGVMLA